MPWRVFPAQLRPLESMYTGVGAFETSVLANVKALAARVETLEEVRTVSTQDNH